jgi:hypothetical protein
MILVYGMLEISPLKYCLLKSMAAQSKAVETELVKILNKRADYRILNKEYKRLEKIFVGKLNTYLFELRNYGTQELRKEILKTNNLEL